MCSGEQIRAPSGVDYILSAGHCKVLEENHQVTVTDADGNSIKRDVIAEDPNSDLLLIEGLPNLKGLDIASSDEISQHVRTFTHGGNTPTHKTDGEMMETKQVQIFMGIINDTKEEAECMSQPKFQSAHVQTFFGDIQVCLLQVDETAATASIVPGSSGGMLVDDAGDLVGVASCTDGQFGYFVTLHDINKFLSGY
jgi:S1-C subfamily serine protease